MPASGQIDRPLGDGLATLPVSWPPTEPPAARPRIQLVPVRPAPPLPAILFEGEEKGPVPALRSRVSRETDPDWQPVTGEGLVALEAPWVPALADAPDRVEPGAADPRPGLTEAPSGGAVEAESVPEPSVGAAEPWPPMVQPALPTGYASGSIWLVAREPFLVVVHWDFSLQQLDAAALGPGPGGWQLRLHQGDVTGRLVTRRALPSASGEAFVPVLEAGRRYVVELGYETVGGRWLGLAMSAPVTTPPEFRPELPDGPDPGVESTPLVWGRVAPVGPVADGGDEGGWLDLPAAGWPAAKGGVPGKAGRSAELRPERISRRQAWELQWQTWNALAWSVPGASGLSLEGGPETVWERGETLAVVEHGGEPMDGPDVDACGVGLSSGELGGAVPSGGPRRSFWFEVNAEVILYGRTERDARVTIAGRPVTLRDDGSFSFRFVLPDGEFPLAVQAVSAAGDDGRTAEVRLVRSTVRSGDVGAQEQDASLWPPVPEAVC